MEKLTKAYSWIIIIVVIIIHFFFLAGALGDFNLQHLIRDLFSILHLAFTLTSNIIIAGVGADKGIEVGIVSAEFKLANDINNDINVKVMPIRKEFNSYIRVLNQEEKENAEEEFLLDKGVKNKNELTKKQLRKFKRIKYTKHDIKGFTLPLYFEQGKGNKIKYNASFDINMYKARKRISKTLMSIITGFMTVNIVFSMKNFKEAFSIIIIVIGGLIISYLTNLMPVVYKFKFEMPNKVINKKTLYDSFLSRRSEFIQKVSEEPLTIERVKGVEKE